MDGGYSSASPVTPLTSSWAGEYMDGRTATLHAVVVRLDSQGLQLWPAGQERAERLALWPRSSLRVDDSYKQLLRVTSSAYPEAAVTVADPGFRDMLVASGVLRGDFGQWRLLAVLVAAVAVIAAAIYWGVDPVARRIAHKIPLSYEAKLNDGILAHFAETRCSTAAGDAAVETLLSKLRGPESRDVPFKVVTIKSKEVNAFALPGGTVVLTRGFLQAAESPDEVAGVLGHEMEHVIQRHVTTRLVRTAILTGIWQFTVGDYSGFLVVDPSTMYQLATLSFDRRDEAAADRGALRMLDRAKISRHGFGQFFARLRQEGGSLPAILSTHPDHADRIAAIDNGATGDSGRRLSPALADAEWQALRAICDAAAAEDESTP